MTSNGHARLSPSNHRWPHCPGSIREEAAYPDESGPAAIDGTGSHLLLELALCTLRNDVRAEEWLHRTIGEGHEEKPEGWYVDRDRVERVQMALDYVARRRQELQITSIEAESQSLPGFCCTPERNDWWGTVDITIRGICRTTGQKVIEVVDYKDGRGWVSEKDNPQLIGYAFGKLGVILYDGPVRRCNPDKDPHQVRMTIVQPKTNPVVRYQEISGSELWDKGLRLGDAARATDNPNAPLVAGKHCEWCKHGRAGNCTEKNKIATEGIQIMTDISTNTGSGRGSIIEAIQTGQIAPATMSDEQIASVLDAAALIKKLIDQVEEEAGKRLEGGGKIPGYTMGTGRGSNNWAEEEEVIAAKLKGMRFKKEEIYPPKLISPAQALKKKELTDRQKKALEGLIKYEKGKAKVVKDNSAVSAPDVATMFMGCAEPVKEEPKQISFL